MKLLINKYLISLNNLGETILKIVDKLFKNTVNLLKIMRKQCTSKFLISENYK